MWRPGRRPLWSGDGPPRARPRSWRGSGDNLLMRLRHASTLIAAALAGFWGTCLALPHWRGGSDLLDRVEAPLADLRFVIQGPRPAPDAITIVAIDDRTIQTTGSYPLPRATMAQLVSSLALMKPNVIALDILFIDPGPPEGDGLS